MPQNHQSQNYHALGGALLVFVILGYISCALFGVIGIYLLARYIPIASYFGGYYTFIILLAVAYCALIVYLGIRLNLKIHRKDNGFLRLFQIIAVVQTVLMILAFITSASNGIFNDVRFMNGILSVAYMVGWNYYFFQSQRVRVYFGGEEYLQCAFVGANFMGRNANYAGGVSSWTQGKPSRFCTQCGKPIPGDAQFCTSCGSRQE